MRDAQADVPSTRWLRAQLAFKNSMVHGILQFTPSIAFCYVLHRCVSRDIRCRESFSFTKKPRTMRTPRTGRQSTSPLSLVFLGTGCAGGCYYVDMISVTPQKGKHRHTSTRLHMTQNKGFDPYDAGSLTCSRVVLPCRIRQ